MSFIRRSLNLCHILVTKVNTIAESLAEPCKHLSVHYASRRGAAAATARVGFSGGRVYRRQRLGRE